jgi:hypothetical protein
LPRLTPPAMKWLCINPLITCEWLASCQIVLIPHPSCQKVLTFKLWACTSMLILIWQHECILFALVQHTVSCSNRACNHRSKSSAQQAAPNLSVDGATFQAYDRSQQYCST